MATRFQDVMELLRPDATAGEDIDQITGSRGRKRRSKTVKYSVWQKEVQPLSEKQDRVLAYHII